MEKKEKSTQNQSFLNCINLLNQCLKAKKPYQDLLDTFFKYTDHSNNKDYLIMNDFNQNDIQKFLEILIILVSNDTNPQICLHALMILFTYIKHNIKVYSLFQPNKEIIKGFKLDKFITNKQDDNYEKVLDFICFLLRYYDQVDYTYFSDSQDIITKIKRAEIRRIWIDVEDILEKTDNLEGSFSNTQENTTAAFGEIFAYFDGIKKEMKQFQQQQQQSQKYDPKSKDNIEDKDENQQKIFLKLNEFQEANSNLTSRINTIEENLNKIINKLSNNQQSNQNIKQQQQQLTTNRSGNISPSINNDNKDKNNDNDKAIKSLENNIFHIQNTLLGKITQIENELSSIRRSPTTPQYKDHERSNSMNSSSTNQKLKNKINRINLNDSFAKANKTKMNDGMINKLKTNTESKSKIPKVEEAIEDQKDKSYDYIEEMNNKIQNHEEVINSMHNEINALKNASLNSKNLLPTKDHINIVDNDMQVTIKKLNDQYNNHDDLIHKIINEIISLKADISIKNQPDNQNLNDSAAMKNYIEMAINNAKNSFTDNLDKLSAFIQEFINEQANDKIRLIKAIESTAQQKMDNFEWLVQNYEFFSPNIITNLINWFQDLFSNKNANINLKNAYTITKHNSDVIKILSNLINDCILNNALKKLVGGYLKMLEILLMSDSNLDKGISIGIIEILLKIIFENNFDSIEKKSALRSLSISFRNNKTIDIIIQNFDYINYFVNILKQPIDEESIIISTRFFRICFREDIYMDVIKQIKPEVIYFILDYLNIQKYSDITLEEILAAIKNYTQKSQDLDNSRWIEKISIINELANQNIESKKKQYAIAILKNIYQNPKMRPYIKYHNNYSINE